MDILKHYDMSILVNDNERMVFEELGRRADTFADENICDCQDCIADMAALALNSLKPHYHASLLGSMYASAVEESEFSLAVKKAVNDAIDKVKSNPAHY